MDIFLGTLFFVTCVLLIIVVLLQKGRGGGLAAAFGGAGHSAFGTRTGDVFTWVTIVLTALFLILAVGATFAFRPAMQTVAPPVLDPPGGDFAGPVKVAMECPTPGAKIHYTTDGSEPTLESKSYELGLRIEVKPPVTVKARAFRSKDMNPSEIVTVSYGLKEAPPEAPQLEPPAEQPPEGEKPPTTEPAP